MLKRRMFFLGSALAVFVYPFLYDTQAPEKFSGSAVCNAGCVPVQTEGQAACAFFCENIYAAVCDHIFFQIFRGQHGSGYQGRIYMFKVKNSHKQSPFIHFTMFLYCKGV